MDIIISDSWLREFLKTKATSRQIGESLALCGPSVERVVKVKKDVVYLTEVTTNRVDTASHLGIAREAAAILPRFKIDAKLTLPVIKSKEKFVKKVKYLNAVVDSNLCPRFTAVLIRNVKINASPSWMQDRLEAVGIRAINNVVDISNYIMHELGQPVHTFDYDKIKGHKMVLREGRKGEKITTLDGKEHILPGGDIVIEDGGKRLIDLAGIMGGENSAVDKDTKNVLLFIQTYNPTKVRQTSMALAARTEAAVLFEKGTDPELVTLGVRRGIDLFRQLTNGVPEKEILDIYPNPYRPKRVKIDYEFINSRIGIEIDKKEVDRILNALGIVDGVIPSWRERDIEIAEDIVEEVARIYGYHNLPSVLMIGAIPQTPTNYSFKSELKIKQILKGYGGVEVYTLSLTDRGQLKLKNPLGTDTAYLRDSLRPSLINAANSNLGEKAPFHIFEMANVYIPQRGDLPKEEMRLAGIFSLTDFRHAKGVIEGLLNEINIDFKTEILDDELIYKGLGKLERVMDNYLYYDFSVEALLLSSKSNRKYKAPAKYPAQVEDLTFNLQEKTYVGDFIHYIHSLSNQIVNVELTDVFENSYTFRVWYQDLVKTLTDIEVEKIRNKIIESVKTKFGGTLKG